MSKFRVVFKIPAVTYAYYDIEAENATALQNELSQQANINDIISGTKIEGVEQTSECTEVDEMADWRVDEIGLARTE